MNGPCRARSLPDGYINAGRGERLIMNPTNTAGTASSQEEAHRMFV